MYIVLFTQHDMILLHVQALSFEATNIAGIF